MKHLKRLLVFLFVLTASLAIFAGCKPTEQNTPGEKVTLRLGGETADANGAYALSLAEGESKTYTVVVGTLTDYTLTATSSEPSVASATATETSLKVEAIKEGTTVVTLSEKDGKANALTLNVTVTAKQNVPPQPTAPTRLSISGTDEGVGTLEDPYKLSITTAKGAELTLVVSPSDADNTFDWTVGELKDGAFTEKAGGLTVAQNDNRLTISSASQGTFAVRGVAHTGGGVTVYLLVTVTEHVPLTSITTDDLKESEDAQYAYEFVTAKGTSWDMTNGISARGQDLLDGNVMGGRQAPLLLTYFPTLSTINFHAEPAGATNQTWIFHSSDEQVFKLNPDGTWTAGKAGDTDVTVTNALEEATVKIKVTVHDTIADGILSSEFEEADVDETGNWGFDLDNPDNWTEEIWEQRKPMYEAWHLVMNRTIAPNGDDGNQKIFYLGTTERIYGICLETQSRSAADAVLALAWAKVKVPQNATELEVSIGNNDKTQGKYRILFVEADGTTTDLTSGWVNKSKANDDGKPYAQYNAEALRGKTGALVVQAGQNEQNNNCELHIKGLWFNTYKQVEGVTLSPAQGEVGQGGQVQINASVTPADASYKTLTYTVTAQPEGGEGKVTVSASGLVSVAQDAPVGEYKISVVSTDNEDAKAEYTLTVTQYTALTSFGATLSFGGRAVSIGDLSEKTVKLTFDESGVFTDSPLELAISFNEGASVTTYRVGLGTEGVVSLTDGVLKAIGAGSTTVTLTPDDNEGLAISFTVEVEAYTEASLIEGTKITKTFAALMGADESSLWNSNAAFHRFVFATVDKRHSNAKINYDGDVMQLESHVVVANSNDPVNIGYNKIKVAENAQYLTFEVHGHGDDRYLESGNLRVRVLTLTDGVWSADTLLEWTTIANRWGQQNEWYAIALDFSAYAGKEVIVLFEAVGGVQNNGNFPKDSDSAAGGYLYLRNVAIGTEKAETALVPVEGNIPAGDSYRMYANDTLSALGWIVSAKKNSGSYRDGVYQPLVLRYEGSLAEPVALPLTTETFYSNVTAAALYPWGVFPALNNSEAGTIELISSSDEVFTVENGSLHPVANGNADLSVKAKTYGSTEETITFTVKVEVAGVSKKIIVNEDHVTLEPGATYTLNYDTIPSDATVTALLFDHPSGGENGVEIALDNKTVTVSETAPQGDYTIQLFFTDDMSVEAQEVVITVKPITLWGDKNAILDENTGWSLNDGGSMDMGVGEGADLNRGGSYFYRTLEISEGYSKLTVNARTFVRDGETDAHMYVSVFVDGEEVKIRAKDATEDHVVIDTRDSKFNDPVPFEYDLSAYIGRKVEVRIGITQGTHCCITSIQLAD